MKLLFPNHLFTAGLSLISSLSAVTAQSWSTQRWGNENANYTFVSGAAGAFSATWTNPNGGNFVIGKGLPTSEMRFNYTGTYESIGHSNSYLALYGWTTNPLVEYYVMENFGVHHPADNPNQTCFGTFQSDGGSYEVWMKWRVNAPSIIGTATFPQFWSVRTRKRVGGTITTGNHFAAWERAGLELGSHRNQRMVMGIEGQWGSGRANITGGVYPTTTIRETATPTTRTERPTRTGECRANLNP